MTVTTRSKLIEQIAGLVAEAAKQQAVIDWQADAAWQAAAFQRVNNAIVDYADERFFRSGDLELLVPLLASPRRDSVVRLICALAPAFAFLGEENHASGDVAGPPIPREELERQFRSALPASVAGQQGQIVKLLQSGEAAAMLGQAAEKVIKLAVDHTIKMTNDHCAAADLSKWSEEELRLAIADLGDYRRQRVRDRLFELVSPLIEKFQSPELILQIAREAGIIPDAD